MTVSSKLRWQRQPHLHVVREDETSAVFVWLETFGEEDGFVTLTAAVRAGKEEIAALGCARRVIRQRPSSFVVLRTLSEAE